MTDLDKATQRKIMTLSARFSLLHSDLNDFLFAAVGDEPNGDL
jgi:hypothetical protein